MPYHPLKITVFFFTLLAVLCPMLSFAQEIQAPFAARAPEKKPSAYSCAVPPTPVIQLKLTSKYGKDGSERDTVDKQAKATFDAEMKPVNDYLKTVVKQAERYTQKGKLPHAECVITWLHAWAKAGALMQMENETAQFKRATTLSGLNFALMQVRPAIAPDDARLAVITSWLSNLTHSTIKYYSTEPAASRNSAHNNHRYWVGLAAASTAVLSNERDLLDWGVDAYRQGVCGATPEGALPLEVSRGTKARGYHLFALSALIPLANIAEANGINAFEFCDGALHRIVNFSLNSITDVAAISALADTEQDAFRDNAKLPASYEVTFMELYHQHFPGKALLEQELLALRPLRSSNLGGDQTLLYSQPKAH